MSRQQNPHLRTEAKKKARAVQFQMQRNAEKRRLASEKARVFADRNRKLDVDLAQLRSAVGDYIAVQDEWLKSVPKDALLPGDWVRAYRRLKRVLRATEYGGEPGQETKR